MTPNRDSAGEAPVNRRLVLLLAHGHVRTAAREGAAAKDRADQEALARVVS